MAGAAAREPAARLRCDAASLVARVREGFLLALLLAAPMLVAALVAGILTGLLAAFTQIQDPAVSLVPRVAAVGAAIVAVRAGDRAPARRVRESALAADHEHRRRRGHDVTLVVLALRGVAAMLVLTTLVGGIPRIVQAALAVTIRCCGRRCSSRQSHASPRPA